MSTSSPQARGPARAWRTTISRSWRRCARYAHGKRHPSRRPAPTSSLSPCTRAHTLPHKTSRFWGRTGLAHRTVASLRHSPDQAKHPFEPSVREAQPEIPKRVATSRMSCLMSARHCAKHNPLEKLRREGGPKNALTRSTPRPRSGRMNHFVNLHDGDPWREPENSHLKKRSEPRARVTHRVRAFRS